MNEKETPPRCTLFVSYAHEDKKMVDELRKPFIPLMRNHGCVLFWEDSNIRGGEAWRQKISEAMAQAKYAIVLMSSDFIASEFIYAEELPYLLERHRKGKLTLLPVLVGPVDMAETGLAEFQFINPPEKPLLKLKPIDRNEWFVKIAKQVKDSILGKNENGEPSVSAVEAGSKQNEKASTAETLEAAESASWASVVPARLALAEIVLNISRLKQHTKSQGYLVFDRDGYYVQLAFYPGLDDSGVVVEAQSNAYLQGDRRLSLEQLRHMTEDLQFEQFNDEENLMLYAPLDGEEQVSQLARIVWYVLSKMYQCPTGTLLSIDLQCQ